MRLLVPILLATACSGAEVARLGRAWVAGLQEAGCIPVVKHIPGHGRALVDSHLDLPRVAADRDRLAEDCAPFAALAGSGRYARGGAFLAAAALCIPLTVAGTLGAYLRRPGTGQDSRRIS